MCVQYLGSALLSLLGQIDKIIDSTDTPWVQVHGTSVANVRDRAQEPQGNPQSLRAPLPQGEHRLAGFYKEKLLLVRGTWLRFHGMVRIGTQGRNAILSWRFPTGFLEMLRRAVRLSSVIPSWCAGSGSHPGDELSSGIEGKCQIPVKPRPSAATKGGCCPQGPSGTCCPGSHHIPPALVCDKYPLQ